MDGKRHIAISPFQIGGVANFGDIVHDINQYIDLIHSAGDEKAAQILTGIGKGILTDPRLDNPTRKEAMENLQLLAWEASLPFADRRLGVVKGALAYLLVLLTSSLDALNCLHKHLADLRAFFDIAG
jgi:hypothetical protein